MPKIVKGEKDGQLLRAGFAPFTAEEVDEKMRTDVGGISEIDTIRLLHTTYDEFREFRRILRTHLRQQVDAGLVAEEDITVMIKNADPQVGRKKVELKDTPLRQGEPMCFWHPRFNDKGGVYRYLTPVIVKVVKAYPK